MNKENSTAAEVRAADFVLTRAAMLFPAIAAIMLGLFIVWGVGLANPATLHNAAHDSRHALGFPCH
jgi:cobalt transporter subunit CbtB